MREGRREENGREEERRSSEIKGRGTVVWRGLE